MHIDSTFFFLVEYNMLGADFPNQIVWIVHCPLKTDGDQAVLES